MDTCIRMFASLIVELSECDHVVAPFCLKIDVLILLLPPSLQLH